MVRIFGWLFDGFPGTLEIISSDWDGDGTVSTTDYVEMRRMILGIDVDNPYQNYFVVPARFTFPTVDPFDIDIDDYSTLTFADTDVVDNMLEVFVFKVGDVDQTAFLIGEGETTNRARKDLVYEDKFLTAGEVVSIPFSLSDGNSLLGTTFKLRGADLEFGDLVSTDNQSNFLTHATPSQLAVSYVNNAKIKDLSFTIEVTAARDGYLSELLQLDDSLNAEMVDGNEEEHGLVLTASSVSSTEDLSAEDIRIFPNPMSDVLNLQFDNAQSRSLTLYNAAGQNIISQNSETESISLTRTQEMNSGIYMLKVDSEKDSKSYRIIIK